MFTPKAQIRNVQRLVAARAQALSRHGKVRLDGLARAVRWELSGDLSGVSEYVDRLRQANPGLSDEQLARKVVRQHALRSALLGGVGGVPGLTLAPLVVPAEAALSHRLQDRMAAAIAHVYGHDLAADPEALQVEMGSLRDDGTTRDALKRAGLYARARWSCAALGRLAAPVSQRLGGLLGRAALVQAGVASCSRWMPVVAAVPGAGVDWAWTRAAGERVIRVYSAQGGAGKGPKPVDAGPDQR